MATMFDRPKFRDEKSGRTLFVMSGIGSPPIWFTGYLTDRNRRRRFVSPSLPCRETIAEALADLEAHAAKKGWQRA